MFGTTIKTTSTKYEMALRNRIHGFKMQMAECAHGGLQVSPEGMDQFLEELDALQTMATEMGNELKHHRLNYQYARDKEAQEKARAVLAAANDTNSNVIAWPVCARPIGDGR
jgi:chemotaxis protein histidine kinase CheA